MTFLGLLATNGKYKNPIIVSVDKDMRTIPCKLIAAEDNRTYYREESKQTLVRDVIAGDSYRWNHRVKGMGMVTASTPILADTPDTQDALWSKVC